MLRGCAPDASGDGGLKIAMGAWGLVPGAYIPQLSKPARLD
jgi:hypothetical protein